MEGMSSFVPRQGLENGHWMTLYGWGNPRYFPRLPAPVPRFFDIEPEARVLAHCHWQPAPWEHPTLLTLHGLNGSSEAHYMKGLAAKAFARGMNVLRLNQRNCGGTEHLSSGLFHSGLTADAAFVLRELIEVDGLSSLAIAGYSLGGNIALKLAGEYGAQAPTQLHAICAVSPILEIGACVRALERPANRLYQWNFVKDLKARMRRKFRAWPGRYDPARLSRIRTVREFDDAYTAPHFGFRDADDYYYRASAMRVIDRIRVPALVITSKDDPFVPWEPFTDPKLTANRHITTVVCEHGGHCGFVGTPTGEDDGYWAEKKIVDFVEQSARAAAEEGAEALAGQA